MQKYLHDLDAWNALSSRSRSGYRPHKLDDIELADDVNPANSHVALNTIDGAGRRGAGDPSGQHAVRRAGTR